jgi:adenylate cyclase
LAEATAHPLTQAQAHGCSTDLEWFRRDARRAHDHAERSLTLATEHGLTHWRLSGHVGRGWARAVRGDTAAGLAELRGALDAFSAIGTEFNRPLHLTMLADALGVAGRLDEAHEALAEAARVTGRNGEHVWAPDIHRLAGALHIQRAERFSGAARARALEDASTALQHALAAAAAQDARSLELRAAMSLCRLSRHTGDQARARSVLADIYGRFTEGFETRDLKEARALIRDTGSPRR